MPPDGANKFFSLAPLAGHALETWGKTEWDRFFIDITVFAATKGILGPPVCLFGFRLREDSTDWLTSTGGACKVLQTALRGKLCGAGEVAAREISQDAAGVECWVCLLEKGGLNVVGRKQNENVVDRTLPLDLDPAKVLTSSEALASKAPSQAVVTLPDGQSVVVFGRTGENLMFSQGLVQGVATGFMRLTAAGYPTKTVKVTEKKLTQLLLDLDAHVIAEAVRALRKLKGDPSRRITRLLRTRSELARLSAAVKFELDGSTS
jgi:hypothetical protein